MKFFQSSFDPSWVELRDGSYVVQELQILFPLKKLPNLTFPTVEAAMQWLDGMERKMAKNQAVRFLAKQSLASSILSIKLRDKGYCSRICSEVVEECRQGGYLFDDELWPRIIERELEKGYGPKWIEWKWKIKGMPEGLIDSIATPERQRKALKKIMQKLKKSPKQTIQALQRRGFSIDVILQEIEIF